MTDASSSRRNDLRSRRSARKQAAERQARQRRIMLYGGAAVIVAVIAAAILVLVNRDDTSSSAGTIAYDTLNTDGRFLGDPDAPVDLVVYSDFQCPFCKQFDTQDFSKVVENFVKPGDVRVEWRPMPIISQLDLESPDNESVQAAEAAICAADQDAYWPYSEALYEAQAAENSGVYTIDMLEGAAADLGLDTDAFSDCLESGEHQDDVIAFRKDAVDRGVSGTPAFLINDQLVTYTRQGYDKLEDQLNTALAGDLVDN